MESKWKSLWYKNINRDDSGKLGKNQTFNRKINDMLKYERGIKYHIIYMKYMKELQYPMQYQI